MAAGKLFAERTQAAREAQKKATAEYGVIIENKAKPPQEVPAAPSPATEGNAISSSRLSTTQWLAVGSIVVSLVGIYYKRGELRPSTTKRLPHNMRHNNLRPRSLSLPLLLNKKKGG